MRSRIGKSVIISAIAATMGMGATPASTVTSSGVDNQGNSQASVKGSMNQKSKAKQTKTNRLTSSRNYRYRWLTVVNKESFKQSRRKQLKLRSKKKARRNGQA